MPGERNAGNGGIAESGRRTKTNGMGRYGLSRMLGSAIPFLRRLSRLALHATNRRWSL